MESFLIFTLSPGKQKEKNAVNLAFNAMDPISLNFFVRNLNEGWKGT